MKVPEKSQYILMPAGIHSSREGMRIKKFHSSWWREEREPWRMGRNKPQVCLDLDLSTQLMLHVGLAQLILVQDLCQPTNQQPHENNGESTQIPAASHSHPHSKLPFPSVHPPFREREIQSPCHTPSRQQYTASSSLVPGTHCRTFPDQVVCQSRNP